MNTYPEITRFLIGGVFLVLAIFGASRLVFPPSRRGAKGEPPLVVPAPPPRPDGVPPTRVVVEMPPVKPPRLDPCVRLRTLAAQADEKASGQQPSILAAMYRERAAAFRKAALIVEGKE